MGTPIVHMPGRGRGYGEREQQPRARADDEGVEVEGGSFTESEKGVLRKSEDSEKEGTRWIEGMNQ